jgi:TfdA family taurine catabolism dioxygenase TauD
MATAFPDAARIDVSADLAAELLNAAERLPHYANKEFYSTDLQTLVSNRVREACHDGFDWIVGAVREKIALRPYCTVVRGLRFDEGNRLFVALNRAFGELVARPYEEPRAQLVHYVQPATDIASARGGHESERLHTDTADWTTPVELISMVCLRADPRGGGRSRVLDVDTIRNQVKDRLGSRTLELLESEPVPWQLAPYWGGGVTWRTVLTESSLCWRRYTIELALESEGAGISDQMREALDGFEQVISTTEDTVDFLMREGDLLFSDNHRTVHARTPISNGVTSERLMIRSWIRTT